MATKLISLGNLETYQGLIKQYIDDADALSIKRIAYDSSTRVVSFYKTATAPQSGTDTPAYTVTLPDTSNFLEKFDVTAGTGDAAVGDYVKVAAGGVLESAGSSLPAADISIVDAGSLITATDVEGALQELASASAGGVASKTVYITETAGSSSDVFSKRYGVYQGATGSAASPVAGEKLVDIDIPKDMVVEDGSVVDIVFVATDNSLHEGSASGTDVTTEIKGTGTATSADAGKYIKLTIANATSSHLWIKATDLVDVYTAEQNASQIQLAIDANNVISASVVAGSIGATELDSDAVTTAKIADENVTKAKLAQGVQDSLDLADSAIQTADMIASNVVYEAGTGGAEDITVADAIDDLFEAVGAGGSVSEQIAAAIGELDSSTGDVGVTATSGSVMNAITSLDITDGKISAYGYTVLGSAALQADTYFLKSADYAIADTTDIQNLFS